MTRTQFAKALKVSRMTVWRWEEGVEIPHPAFIELAKSIAEKVTSK